MWTNLPQLGLSDKNGFFLRRSLNCELKMAVFRGKVLAAQFVNAFTWQFIRDTPAPDTGGQRPGAKSRRPRAGGRELGAGGRAAPTTNTNSNNPNTNGQLQHQQT